MTYQQRLVAVQPANVQQSTRVTAWENGRITNVSYIHCATVKPRRSSTVTLRDLYVVGQTTVDRQPTAGRIWERATWRRRLQQLRDASSAFATDASLTPTPTATPAGETLWGKLW